MEVIYPILVKEVKTMWSNLYAYYNIRSDEHYLEFRTIEEITEILEKSGTLQKARPNVYRNLGSFPWIEICIALTANGNFSLDENKHHDAANLLSVVTSKEYDQSIYLDLLFKIAKRLNWEVVLEADDEGNEDIVIFSPKG